VAVVGLVIVQKLQSEAGATVTVTMGGETYGTYPLDKNTTVEMESDAGYNRMIIEDGYVRMEEADCPDQYCVKHAKIHYNHETIVCLPHELVIEISGGDNSEVDVVTQ
jgi:hypothetical protein